MLATVARFYGNVRAPASCVRVVVDVKISTLYFIAAFVAKMCVFLDCDRDKNLSIWSFMRNENNAFVAWSKLESTLSAQS